MTPAHVLPLLAASAVLFGTIGGLIGARKGYPAGGLLLGALLGLLGVLIIACCRPSQKELVRRETLRQIAAKQAADSIRREQG